MWNVRLPGSRFFYSFAALGLLCVANTSAQSVSYMVQDSPPHPPKDAVRPVATSIPRSVMMLEGVPTSTWTYGCTATSAGMLFGYYDRHGYPDMYTGPTNGGVCPLSDLGQGDDPSNPIPGACSIIATQNGFDGRTTAGHVDDYWIGYSETGPDPWEATGVEHEWSDCTADFLGTNQWKWSHNGMEWNRDGSTVYWYNDDGSPMEDHIQDAEIGLPQTSCCHGMKLFAESRGYTVETNYNQLTDTQGLEYGFTFEQFMAEIDAGYPVLIHVTGHTMIGVGYNDIPPMVYIHDTWDNLIHTMSWTGGYAGRELKAVTVFHLAIEDCNGNGIQDSLDMANCDGSPWCSDCNANDIIDECDDVSQGDYNADGSVDLDDFSAFADCIAGPETDPTPTQAECEDLCLRAFDSDNDDDVDLADFAVFQSLITSSD